MESRRIWARRWIVAGFVLIAAGALTILISDLVGAGFRPLGTAYTIEEFASPAGTVSSGVAWWFLSKLFARGAEDRRLAHQALVWLAVESLCAAVLSFVELIEYHSLHFAGGLTTAFTIAPWIIGIGAVSQTVGFLLMMTSYSKNPHVNASLAAYDHAVDEEGEDVSLSQLQTPLEP
jgi:general stress protein CsbA